MQNFLLYAVTVLIWGSTWFIIKFQLGVVHPLLSVSYRFALAFLILLVYCAVRGKFKKLTMRQHCFIALQGFFLFCFNYWLILLGTQYLTTGLVAVCFSTIPILNIINQKIFLKIPTTRNVLLACVLGLTGILCVFWPEVEHLNLKDTTLLGLSLSLLSTLAASFGNILSLRNTRSGLSVTESTTFGMGYGALISFILALTQDASLTFEMSFNYIWSLLYLALFGSVVAFGSYLTLIARIGADRAAYISVLFPLVALTISTVFENYVWTPQSLAGVILIVAGNLLVMRKKPLLKQNAP